MRQPIEKQIDSKLLLQNRAIKEGNILLYEDAEILNPKEIEQSIKYYQNRETKYEDESEGYTPKSSK